MNINQPIECSALRGQRSMHKPSQSPSPSKAPFKIKPRLQIIPNQQSFHKHSKTQDNSSPKPVNTLQFDNNARSTLDGNYRQEIFKTSQRVNQYLLPHNKNSTSTNKRRRHLEDGLFPKATTRYHSPVKTEQKILDNYTPNIHLNGKLQTRPDHTKRYSS